MALAAVPKIILLEYFWPVSVETGCEKVEFNPKNIPTLSGKNSDFRFFYEPENRKRFRKTPSFPVYPKNPNTAPVSSRTSLSAPHSNSHATSLPLAAVPWIGRLSGLRLACTVLVFSERYVCSVPALDMNSFCQPQNTGFILHAFTARARRKHVYANVTGKSRLDACVWRIWHSGEAIPACSGSLSFIL